MMKRFSKWCLPIFLISTVPGWAAGVWIDSSQVALTSTGATVINARLRASNGSDLTMADGAGSAATTGPTLGHNLGTVGAVSSQQYAFTLEHRVGQGMIFRMVDNQTTSQTWVLAYGSGFSPGLPGASPPTLNVATQATLGGRPPSGLAGFNSLRLEVQASEAHAAAPAEEARLSGLYFTSPTLSVQDGAFDPVVMTPTTPGQAFGEVVGGVATVAPDGFAFQRLVADEPLTAHDWTLGGNVLVQRSGGGDGESVRFVVYGQQVTAVFLAVDPIPEPTAALLCGLAGLLGLRRRRA